MSSSNEREISCTENRKAPFPIRNRTAGRGRALHRAAESVRSTSRSCWAARCSALRWLQTHISSMTQASASITHKIRISNSPAFHTKGAPEGRWGALPLCRHARARLF